MTDVWQQLGTLIERNMFDSATPRDSRVLGLTVERLGGIVDSADSLQGRAFVSQDELALLAARLLTQATVIAALAQQPLPLVAARAVDGIKAEGMGFGEKK